MSVGSRWTSSTVVLALVVAAWVSVPVGADAGGRGGHGHEATPWPGGRWEPAEPSYEMTVVTDIPIVMDDGVTLLANVGYPTDLATGE